MLIQLLLLGAMSSQPASAKLIATPSDCRFAEVKCISTDKAIAHRAANKQLDLYCDSWKDACIRAGLHWDRR
jgi:hypothetical protein